MEYAKRKSNRLNGYDYSSYGLYFITICTKDRMEILWTSDVGDGVLDVPLCCAFDINTVKLSSFGSVIKKHIRSMNNYYSDIKILQYVIMPNHIHFVVQVFQVSKDGTSRTPSTTNQRIPQLISTLKRFVNKEIGFNIFQRSYHDHIIRNKKEFEIISKYIHNNPANWEKDCFYTQKEN